MCFIPTFVYYVCTDCGDPDELSNGHVTWNGTMLRSVATYKCNEKYNLDGPSERTCNSSNKWDLNVPVCVLIGKL